MTYSIRVVNSRRTIILYKNGIVFGIYPSHNEARRAAEHDSRSNTMKLKLIVHKETVIEVDKVDELPMQLANKLDEAGEDGVVTAANQSAIQDAIREIISEEGPDGLMDDVDENDVTVEVIEGDFNIDEEKSEPSGD